MSLISIAKRKSNDNDFFISKKSIDIKFQVLSLANYPGITQKLSAHSTSMGYISVPNEFNRAKVVDTQMRIKQIYVTVFCVAVLSSCGGNGSNTAAPADQPGTPNTQNEQPQADPTNPTAERLDSDINWQPGDQTYNATEPEITDTVSQSTSADADSAWSSESSEETPDDSAGIKSTATTLAPDSDANWNPLGAQG